jgi:hypothetical protein
MNSAIGKLERVALREVWKHEAYDFTQWLQRSIDVLNAALCLNLVSVDREQAMQRISLHERIGILKLRAASVVDALLAIKWVGNAGSHLGQLTRDDVFDAFDILETVLDDLFVRNRATTQKLIRDINKRKGPRTKRAKSVI